MTDAVEPPRTPIKGSEIAEGLRRLGLGSGDAVEVHSAMSRLGWVEGGAATVIQALIDVVGEQGAVVMSAYPLSPPVPLTPEEQARGIAWKVRVLDEGLEAIPASGMGAVPAEFCRWPGAVLGQGPHRVCAWGRDAALHSRGYRHLLEIDGWALLLGVGIFNCSSMHLAEEVPVPERIAALMRVPPDVERDYPREQWHVGYGGTPENSWLKVEQEAGRRGLITRGRIGPAECMLFRAAAVVGIYEDLRRADPYGLFGVSPE